MSAINIKPLSYYDKIIVSYSGGKDSTAMLLHLIKLGANPARIELWHQCIDGRGATCHSFFDWPSTDGYVSQFAKAMKIPLSYQWREKGLYGELYRTKQRTKDVRFERRGKLGLVPASIYGQESTRRKWPAKTASLTTRWCSAYLKIDVAARVLANAADLKDKRILFITGERREESTARAKYAEAELHRTNTKTRMVHHWRPIIDWSERQVWDIMEKNRITPHPAYYLGFPRLSCRSCIFLSPDHWATLKQVSPDVIRTIAAVEKDLGFTLDNKFTIQEMAKHGKSLLLPQNQKFVKLAVNHYSENVITNKWILPAGAFGKGGGAL